MTIKQEQFLKDVAEHKMTVIRDDETGRHIRFGKPGTICCSFEIITFPGQLLITGDCGTYSFRRITDMFDFFRDTEQAESSHLYINPGYWGEKLTSIDFHDGYKEFCEDQFKGVINDYLNDWEYDADEDEELSEVEVKAKVAQQVKDEVLHTLDQGEHVALDAAYNFESDYGHQFYDLFEHSFQEYTHRYIWNLFAIAWAVQQYDASKNPEEQAA